jgi:predicted metal-binding protein
MERKPKPSQKSDSGKFQFLADAALAAGAVAAKIIPAGLVTVEDRVRLKCRSGCASYGKNLACPPYAPSLEESRAYLSGYHYAVLVKFECIAFLDENIRSCLLRAQYDPRAEPDQKVNVARFRRELSMDNRRMNEIMLELEKTAFNAGYPFAVTTAFGSCGLCETCNTATGICNHPTRRRFSSEALGINMVRTTQDGGIPIRFPSPNHPEQVAILLID